MLSNLLWGSKWFVFKNHRTWLHLLVRSLLVWHCQMGPSYARTAFAKPASGFPQRWIKGTRDVVMLMRAPLSLHVLPLSLLQWHSCHWDCSARIFRTSVHQTVNSIERFLRAEIFFRILCIVFGVSFLFCIVI